MDEGDEKQVIEILRRELGIPDDVLPEVVVRTVRCLRLIFTVVSSLLQIHYLLVARRNVLHRNNNFPCYIRHLSVTLYPHSRLSVRRVSTLLAHFPKFVLVIFLFCLHFLFIIDWINFHRFTSLFPVRIDLDWVERTRRVANYAWELDDL